MNTTPKGDPPDFTLTDALRVVVAAWGTTIQDADSGDEGDDGDNGDNGGDDDD